MSDPGGEAFFSRWSRRKVQVRQGSDPAADALPAATPAAPAAGPGDLPAVGSEDATVSAAARAVDAGQADPASPPGAPSPTVPAPTLEEAQALPPGSEVSRFVAPGVDSKVRNAAVKQLFADPHFNVMDGLDTYIDDYHTADPIPKSMMRQLVQARMLGLLDDELEEQPLATALQPPPADGQPVELDGVAASTDAAAPGEPGEPAEPAMPSAPALDASGSLAAQDPADPLPPTPASHLA